VDIINFNNGINHEKINKKQYEDSKIILKFVGPNPTEPDIHISNDSRCFMGFAISFSKIFLPTLSIKIKIGKSYA
jgi:hypothetical protein